MEIMLHEILLRNQNTFHPVVPFDANSHSLTTIDFSATNVDLSESILADTTAFSTFVNEKLKKTGALYGIGGYNEHRTIYSRSKVFDTANEPRRLHLGIDIWGEASTPVFAPLAGTIHSFAFNNHFGDYGATIILQHTLEEVVFYTLYGHLSLADIAGLQKGNFIEKGSIIAHFGEPHENGYWPPHLHFQLIQNMYEWQGDYPGVCKYSERDKYLKNSPDPDVILQLLQYARKTN